jgi:SAM-dependent methyltransferase
MVGRRRALILGDGDGRFLAELLGANSGVVVDSVDISSGMIQHARQRIARIHGGIERVRFLVADARSVPLPAAQYDLIVTNFFLDCFPAVELEAVIARVAAASGPTALWVDGDFRLPAGRWTRIAARFALAGMYGFFRLTTRLPARQLTGPGPYLEAQGLHLIAERTWLRGFLSARVWARH